MNKLMTLASVLAVACVANASSFTWGFGNEGDYLDKNGNAFDSGTAFLFLGTVSATDSAFDLSQATYVTSAGYVNDYFGAISADDMASSDAVTSTDAGQAFSLLLFDTEGMTATDLVGYEGDYVLYTGTSTRGTIPGATVDYYAKFIRAGEVEASDWATMSAAGPTPIPEPTSGFLMLLGMAGLALRRRRA